MDIGDRVQHFSTGSIGTVIDTVYSMGSDFQQMCVQWEDDKAPERDSWEMSQSLSVLSAPVYDFSISDQCLTARARRGKL